MVLRMLRVALPPGGAERRGDLRDGQALALLQAVGGFQAYRRAVPGAAQRAPGRALPALRARLPGLGGRLGRRAARRADRGRRDHRDSAAGAAAAAAGRRPRVPRPRAGRRRRRCTTTCRARPGGARARRPDIAERYFADRARRRPQAGRRMNFAIRYLTEYRYDGAGHRQPQRAARARRRRRRPSASTTSTSASTPRRALQRHLDYFGTEVIEFGVAQPARPPRRSTCARAWSRAEPPRAARRRRGTALGAPAYGEAGRRVPAPDRRRARRTARSTSCVGLARDDARWPRCGCCASSIPDRFEYRAGRRPTSARRSQDLLEAGAGVCQDFVAPRAGAAAPPRDRGALRLGLPVGGAARTAARTRSRSTRTPGSRRCCPAAAARRAASGSAPTRPTAGWPARRHVKIGHGRRYADVPADQGRLPRPRDRRARRRGHDDAAGPAGQRSRLSGSLYRRTVDRVQLAQLASNPHPASPVEMQERIRAERDGVPFLLLRDGDADPAARAPARPTATG